MKREVVQELELRQQLERVHRLALVGMIESLKPDLEVVWIPGSTPFDCVVCENIGEPEPQFRSLRLGPNAAIFVRQIEVDSPSAEVGGVKPRSSS
jgi:hypothetical protein